jgi:hypothetical protein
MTGHFKVSVTAHFRVSVTAFDLPLKCCFAPNIGQK